MQSKYTQPIKMIKMLMKFKQYLSLKIQHSIIKYENLMNTKFTKTYRMLKIFTDGTKIFSKDVAEYVRISGDIALNRSSNLTYREVMIYRKTPGDLIKMTPFILLTALPLAQYITLPLGFLFPKQLLCSHYWTPEQRIQFAREDHLKKLYYYRAVFRNLKKELYDIKDDSEKFDLCLTAFNKLTSGTHPTIKEIIQLESIFQNDQPFGLRSLPQKHLINLCKMHGLKFVCFKRRSLRSHIEFIRKLDQIWIKNAMSDSISIDELRAACFLRGLNAETLSSAEMREWLGLWMIVSKTITGNGYA
ncbi:LETM1 domain-containing protein 1-like protein [Sarcoptes scabiei]|uniref:LETM1 domain-containing protein 1-like protein n=1 Tax=Sarcoptes scabiei TaxID=52283 RepID=A0A131ZZV4_SARSC|nr:LETM1 domain-containing protein 1-like protein [Sarcoptes scabiei]